MFSSSNNGNNPFGYFPSLPLPNPTHDDPVYFHYHHDLLPSHPMIPPPLTHHHHHHAQMMNESLLNMAMLSNSAQNLESFNESGFLTQKKAVKKDRHSKICTAQGVRDRRVRLSTDIAREFFDLQDMLGFDKASKTLGWLLNKSKNAIKKVAKMKSSGSNAFSSTSSDCEVVSEDEGHNVSKGKEIVNAMSGENSKKMKRMQKVDILRLESREKARARARERTREKIMCNQNLNQFKKSCNILAQDGEDHHQLGLGLGEDDVFEGSKRKMKPCPILGNQQNSYFPDFPYNQIWDINGGEIGLGQYPNISAGSRSGT